MLKGYRALVAPCLVAVVILLAAIAGCGGESRPDESASRADDAPPGGASATGETSRPPAAAVSTEIPVPTRVATAAGTAPDRPQATSAPAIASTPQLTTEFITPPERDYYRLARELMPGLGEVDPVVRRSAPALEVGHRETFRLVDLIATRQYEREFELRLVTPHAYWFFEEGIDVDQEALARSASEFENSIRPRVVGVFGEEWTPGVDGDPHLYIINANLRGVGGYFNSADEYPSAIRPVSNEIEAIYINVQYLPPGTDIYSQVLAHELQHAIHWKADVSEETWVNEGLSELAVNIAGFPETSILEFRRAGPTSLIHWPVDGPGEGKNYGAGSLFMRYFSEHFGGRDDLRALLTEQGDGIEGLDAYLETIGYEARFPDVFRDWAVANLLDEDSGPYGYADLSMSLPVTRNLKGGDQLASTMPQYANEYIRLEQLPGPAILSFDGDSTTSLLPVDVDSLCWWSNKGDVIDSTLTATIGLRDVDSATLTYDVWFSIEEDWDFAYVEVSEDGGSTWTILETPLSSTDDPLQVSFGPGYTGKSGGWQEEAIPLDQWAGQEILARFQYITDAAIHDHGLCLKDLRVWNPDTSVPGSVPDLISSIRFDGFVWTNNLVRQEFIVQVVYQGDGDSPNRVVQVPLDNDNHGEIRLESDPDARRIVAVVQSLAPSTRMPASYTMRLDRVE